MESSPVIAEAVSYLTKKVDSKTRDVKVLQPTIATQSVSISVFLTKKFLHTPLVDYNCMVFQSINNTFQNYLVLC